jgi:uncharacterized protein (TIGR00297 family)
MAGTSEVRRQCLHIAVGALAFALRDLVWWQAAGVAASAVVFNLLVLPRLAPAIVRADEPRRALRSGLVLYPLAVLALILMFRDHLEIAATAWAIMAAGDGAATLVGTHVRSRPLAWNPDKTIAGLMAFLVFGGAAGAAAFVWTTGAAVGPSWIGLWPVVVPLAAATVAAFVETAPIALDDNVTVPAMAALVLWSLGEADPARLARAVPIVVDRLGPAIALNVAVAIAGWYARTVTGTGAVTGAVIGIVIFATTRWLGWAILMLAFLAAAVTTRLGRTRKQLLGIAEARGGRRGPANAIANTGVAAWAALLSRGMAQPELDELAVLAMVAALTTGASDTVASEIGKAWGRHTWLVTGFRPVPPGTSGAVSAEGTVAGVLAAALLAGAAARLGLITPGAVAVVVVAATVASLVEGALGATLEESGILNNDALNFVNSLIGAGLALLLFSLV